MGNIFSKLFPKRTPAWDEDLRNLFPEVDAIRTSVDDLRNDSEDELRAKAETVKQRIRQSILKEKTSIESLKIKAARERDINKQIELYEEVDSLENDLYQFVFELMNDLTVECFALYWEANRRLSRNRELRVKAIQSDYELATRRKNINIKGRNAIWVGEPLLTEKIFAKNLDPIEIQLLGGLIILMGQIVEIPNGKKYPMMMGLPAFLGALTGLGVHLVYSDKESATKAATQLGPVIEFYGMTLGCIDLYEPNSDERRTAYQADVVIGSHNEFGFDYLRDNMTTQADLLVQRQHFYAIIDEYDTVLIDEARTPLIISGPVPGGDKHTYYELKPRIERLVKKQRNLVRQLLIEARKKISAGDEEGGGLALFRAFRGLPKNSQLIELLKEADIQALLRRAEAFYLQRGLYIADNTLYFTIDEKNNDIQITDKGKEFITQAGEDPDLFVLPDIAAKFSEIESNSKLLDEEKFILKEEMSRDYAERAERLQEITQLLKAYTLFEKDIEYIVRDGKVMIVEEQTRRVLAGRRYSDGLHQAIEAKENVKIEAGTQTFATISLQHYYRKYQRLSGLSGPVSPKDKEYAKNRGMDFVSIPVEVNPFLDEREDLVFRSKREKYYAIIDEVISLRMTGRPVIIGITSESQSGILSRLLVARKIPHNVLNAKSHQREAEILAKAGQSGAVTIAPNKAGRGTDIKLEPGVEEAGGMAVIGVERNDSQRWDQWMWFFFNEGTPGSLQFYLSLEDELLLRFDAERIAKILSRIGPGLEDGEVIRHPIVSQSIFNAQKKIEENNFDMLKRLAEYDGVLNAQREVIYKRRRNALYGERIKIDRENMRYDFCEALITRYTNLADAEGLRLDCLRYLAIDPEITGQELNDLNEDVLIDRLYKPATEAYLRKQESLARNMYEGIQRFHDQNPEPTRILMPFTDGGNRSLRVIVSVDEAIRSNGQAVIDELNKAIMLSVIDEKWKKHLKEMDKLRTSVQNAVFENKDPLLVYKYESFELFQQALNEINQEVSSFLFKAKLEGEEDKKRDDFSLLNTRDEEVEKARKRQAELRRRRRSAPDGGEAKRKLSRSERRRLESSQEDKKKKRPPR